ncbi:hypothetical protein [Halegenticoccus soli]|uniref:hypothetical protein n=1 Tax=Halegenticoccus soli TaxID=1985678 RepID=UPI000C6D3788|nr:hypothetical protein [Halegenticoccus soli]
MQNGAYEIRGAKGDGDSLTIDLGDQTTVKEFTDATDPGGGYEHVLVEGGGFVIPLSAEWSA